MVSDEHVKRLLRELILPDDVDLVIQRSKYWNLGFAWLYFERCDALIWRVPEDGLIAAEVCSELVHLIQRVTREPQDRLHLRALAVLGSGYRAMGHLDRADEVFERAFEFLGKRPSVSRSDVANVLFRLAMLRGLQGRYEKAVTLADQSVGIYRETSDLIRCRYLGEALAARGYIHHRNELALAMKDWGEAIPCTDVKQTHRIFSLAVHNLALGMVQGAVLSEDLSTIEKYVMQASRHFCSKPLSVPKLKVLWLLGMIRMRFGSTRIGEATYWKVRDGFITLGKAVDMALVSVTLGTYLHREDRWDELSALAIETNDLCERLCQDEAAKRAVFLWKETVLAKTASAAVFTTTWKVLEQSSFAEAAGMTTERKRRVCPPSGGHAQLTAPTA